MVTQGGLVPCLIALRNEFNLLAPTRDKSSDGWLDDAAHQSTSSDHNWDETGRTPYSDSDDINEVHAIDVDANLNKTGWTMQMAINRIIARHKVGLDDRLQNIIFNRRIWSMSYDWGSLPYDGKNPHDKHAHFSSRYVTAMENDTSPWGLLPISIGGVMLPHFGDSSEEVRYWQYVYSTVRTGTALPVITVDGDYGPATVAAFTAFARSVGASSIYTATNLDAWTAFRLHREFFKAVAQE